VDKNSLQKVALGADHAGFPLKQAIKEYLETEGYEVEDFGTNFADPCDYPDFIIPAAQAVAQGNGAVVGIVFGATGIGECIAANKVKGVRAALVYDEFTASKSREHNDSNVLSLGGRAVPTSDPELAKRIVKIWLETPFSGEERHVRRLKKIADYEQDHLLP
jgi:ribose 5-phosphate isomerase B